MEHTRRFLIDGMPNVPFAGIDLSWDSPSKRLELKVYLASLDEPPDRRLVITFVSPLAFHCEDEHFSLFPLPMPLPTLDHPNENWMFPSLVVEESSWAKSFADFACEQPWAHLAFISYAEVVHVLCISPPEVNWLPIVEA